MNIDEQMNILRRGTVEIILEEELKERLKLGRPLRVKYGADPSAPDLHLGHSVPLRKLRQFQELGHTVVFIIGDFTARIGDPSESSETRPQLSREEVEANAQTYADQANKILNLSRTELVYNSEWCDPLSFEDIIKLCARHTVARMLERDDFAKRYAQQRPIALHEFLYPIAQGYDSVAVRADVEIGGTDQKFNLLTAREIQKDHGDVGQVVITLPLLEGTDGQQKMSKSLGNHIGLADPPEEKFGRIMSIPDELIIKYFELTTDLSPEEINDMGKALSAGDINPVHFKRRLAREIVAMYDGQEAAERAEQHFDAVHVIGTTEALAGVELPQAELSLKGTAQKMAILELLTAIKLCASRSEARRLVRQGAVVVDGQPVRDELASVTVSSGSILRAGRRVVRIKALGRE